VRVRTKVPYKKYATIAREYRNINPQVDAKRYVSAESIRKLVEAIIACSCDVCDCL